MDRIQECIADYGAWSDRIGVKTVTDLNNIVMSGQTKSLINITEIRHEQQLAKISEYIAANAKEKQLVLISGPSSSGKTTFSKRLKMHLKALDINSISISLDDYYIKKSDMPKNADGTPDYEALESIDYNEFNRDISDLISGKETYIPVYDFVKECATESSITLKNREIVIAEGIHGLNPKIASNIDENIKYKIYCSPLTALKRPDGTRIPSKSNRLIRRLIRDVYFRDESFDATLDMWKNVELGAEKNIFPYTETADIIFNSSLIYELAIYRKHFDKIYNEIKQSSLHQSVLNVLSDLLTEFYPIDDSYVPAMSFIREFIGGSSIDY